jgi:hypothetical protein
MKIGLSNRKQQIFTAIYGNIDRQLKRTLSWKKLRLPRLAEFRKTVAIPDRAEPYLKRMALNQPRTLKEKFLRRAVLYGLAKVDAI